MLEIESLNGFAIIGLIYLITYANKLATLYT